MWCICILRKVLDLESMEEERGTCRAWKKAEGHVCMRFILMQEYALCWCRWTEGINAIVTEFKLVWLPSVVGYIARLKTMVSLFLTFLFSL